MKLKEIKKLAEEKSDKWFDKKSKGWNAGYLTNIYQKSLIYREGFIEGYKEAIKIQTNETKTNIPTTHRCAGSGDAGGG